MNIVYLNGEIDALNKVLKGINDEHKRLFRELKNHERDNPDCTFAQLQTLSYIRGIVKSELSAAKKDREACIKLPWIDCGIMGLVTDDKTPKDDE